MSAQSIAVKPSEIRAIINATFPDYRGPKATVRVQATAEYTASDLLWQDGSKTEVKALRAITIEGTDCTYIAHLQAVELRTAHSGVVPRDMILVEHVTFCGKDLGIRCVVSPDSVFLPKLLPAPVELTDDDVFVLSVHAQLKSGYRDEAYGCHRFSNTIGAVTDALAKRGLLSVNKLGASQITVDSKNALAALPSHRQIRL